MFEKQENLEERKDNVIVPKNNQNYFNYYTIEKGDSLYGIARRYNINPELLAGLNGLSMDDYIYPNQEILIPRAGVQIYVTKEFDTLKDVVKRFKTNTEKLTMENENIYLLPEQLLVFKRENFL